MSYKFIQGASNCEGVCLACTNPVAIKFQIGDFTFRLCLSCANDLKVDIVRFRYESDKSAKENNYLPKFQINTIRCLACNFVNNGKGSPTTNLKEELIDYAEKIHSDYQGIAQKMGQKHHKCPGRELEITYVNCLSEK